MPSLTMSPQLYVLFSTLVEDASGIQYGPQDQELFASKVADHAVEQGFASLLDYYYRLRYDDRDGQETRRLIESLLVHESYFFRELPPLVEIVDTHIRETVQKRGRARVWSAACASGEEPFTLAMLLEERGLLDHVDIIATDLSANVLARAAGGRYSRRALREGHPAAIAAKYLETSSHGVIVAPRCSLRTPEPHRQRRGRSARHVRRDPVSQRPHLLPRASRCHRRRAARRGVAPRRHSRGRRLGVAAQVRHVPRLRGT
jgi:hypothetical protein